ncbi:MAG TPA: methionyl-tRNA formyltransferase [Gemmatimonadaceae bacterium]|nr:methionyl-tRNA formyltransferase [Gemmatimonadaceae bacterium]
MRVLFWGTPDFALPSFRALIGEGFEVIGVVTQPDKPRGRSRTELVPPPVKVAALEEKLPAFQPETPKDEEFVELLRIMQPDVSVVVAYGHILPKFIIDLPRLGTLNVHASLLPKLRGAAPIQAAIREGYGETGVTIMRMVPKLDAGPMLLRVATPLPDDETYGELQQRLSEMGALALVEALSLLAVGELRETPQNDSEATYASKLERDDTRIDWSREAVIVSRVVRAYDPRPGAVTTLRGAEVKLFGARVAGAGCAAPGEVLDIDGAGMLVACGRGSVRVREVQPAGKRRLPVPDWARGRGVSVGDRFGA